jgi:hypothetical protein
LRRDFLLPPVCFFLFAAGGVLGCGGVFGSDGGIIGLFGAGAAGAGAGAGRGAGKGSGGVSSLYEKLK